MTEIWYIEKVCQQVYGVVTEDLKENLNINIPTKERIANFDIFCFIKNFKKYTKIVLTAIAR